MLTLKPILGYDCPIYDGLVTANDCLKCEHDGGGDGDDQYCLYPSNDEPEDK